MRTRHLLSVAAIAVLALVLSACPNKGLVSFGVVMGTVTDTNGYGLADVVVSLGDETVTTSGQGWFVLDELDEMERAVVYFRKAGYVMTSEVTRVRVGESSFLDAVMMPVGVQQTVSGTAGGTVTTPEGGSVVLPPNFAVGPGGTPWTGDVTVGVTLFDPSTEAGLEAFPGEFLGTRLDGSQALLISFAFMDVSLFDPATGAPLDSAVGPTFGLTMPVPAVMQAEAPATIPLWYFDEEAGRWFEESSAVFDGTRYSGNVNHLSIWNCDVAADRSYVVGRVIDCDDGGDPVMGARVTVKGVRGWTSGETSTPSDGTFRIPVDSDHDCTIQPSKNGEFGDIVSFHSAGTDGVYDVGDLCLGVAPVKITLTWKEQPRDLDSHLTVPTDPREHLYYANRPITDANLDTDDTDGFGPEVVTIYELIPGEYRYSVHHFSGESNMTAEGATALMIVDGLGIYSENPPDGGEGVEDVWQVWDFTVNGNGRVAAVNPQRRIAKVDPATAENGTPEVYNP